MLDADDFVCYDSVVHFGPCTCTVKISSTTVDSRTLCCSTRHFDGVLRGWQCVCVSFLCVQFLRSLHKRCTCRRAALLLSFHFQFYFYSFKLILTSQTGQQNSTSYRSSHPSQANRFIRKSGFPHAVCMTFAAIHTVRYYYFYIHIVAANRHKDDCV